jgi:hypothetical protein
VVTAGVTLPSTPPVDGSKPLPRKQISHVRIFEYEGRAATGAAFLFKRAAASPTTHSARRSRRGTGHANCRTWGSPRSASRVIARRRLRRCVTASGKGRCRSPAETRSNRWLWPCPLPSRSPARPCTLQTQLRRLACMRSRRYLSRCTAWPCRPVRRDRCLRGRLCHPYRL